MILAYIDFPAWLKPEIIPGLPVRWYGLMYILAFAVTYLLVMYQIKQERIERTSDDVISIFMWAILGLLIGSRIFSATIYDPTGFYLRNPWLIFWPFRDGQFTGLQGMSYHGGVVGAAAGALLYCRIQKESFLFMADLTAAGIPLGYTFGRIGNYINGELWGRVSTQPWATIFPYAPRFSTSETWVRETADAIGMPYSGLQMLNLPRHPSQLYEAILEGIVLWLVLWLVFRKRKSFDGYLISLYIIGYGIARFIVEYFREPDAELGFIIKGGEAAEKTALFVSPWNISMGQILSLIMIAAGVLFFFAAKRRGGQYFREAVSSGSRKHQPKNTKKSKKPGKRSKSSGLQSKKTNKKNSKTKKHRKS